MDDFCYIATKIEGWCQVAGIISSCKLLVEQLLQNQIINTVEKQGNEFFFHSRIPLSKVLVGPTEIKAFDISMDISHTNERRKNISALRTARTFLMRPPS